MEFKLIANNGAELEVKDHSFWCNEVLFKNHREELFFSDDNEKCGWGDTSDYGSGKYFERPVFRNVTVMFKHYPETKEQFINYIMTDPRFHW